MSDDRVYPIRLEGSPDVIAFASRQADAHHTDRSEPITPEEPFSSPQSALAGALVQNIQLIDMVFKTSTDAIAFLTALAAFVRLPDWHGVAAVKNVRHATVFDPAKAKPEDAAEFITGQ